MPAPSLTFTSGADILIGTAGNDTFTVNNDGDLTSADFAAGRGGTDKLVVNSTTSTLGKNDFSQINDIAELDYSKAVTAVDLTLSSTALLGTGLGLQRVDASLSTGSV